MLDIVKETIDKSVSTVALKSSEFIETNKLKNQVKELESDIEAIKKEIGAAFYKQWKEGNLKIPELEECCYKIDEKTLESSNLKSKIEALLTPNHDINVCKCGALNQKTAKFCVSCGSMILHEDSIACKNCNSLIKKDSKFCSKCGSKIVGMGGENETSNIE